MGFNQSFLPNEGGRTIMSAPWPRSFVEAGVSRPRDRYWLSIGSEGAVEPALHVLVNGVRSIRREFGIPSSKRIPYIIWVDREPPPARELAIMKQLLLAQSLDFRRKYDAPKGTPHVFSSLGVLFPIIDRPDPEIATFGIPDSKLHLPSSISACPPSSSSARRGPSSFPRPRPASRGSSGSRAIAGR